MYFKNFDSWISVKKKIDSEESGSFCRSGEVRWAVLGVNIGSEIDGKGGSYNRPCVVVDVFSDKLVLVFPMSTKVKESAGYVPFTLVDGRVVSVCVHQARVLSPKRILKRIQVIFPDKLRDLKNSYKKFYRL